MPLVTSSETGIFGQTESPLGIFGEMWCCKILCGLFLSLFNYCWNTLTVEGDSPVDLGWIGRIIFSWVAFIGNWAWIFWEASTSNSEYFSRPIVYLVPRGNAEKNPFIWGWKVPETRWWQPGMAWKEWFYIGHFLVTFGVFCFWLVLCHSSWNTSQGVCSCGEAKKCVAS